MRINELACCGVRELVNISRMPCEVIIKKIYQENEKPFCGTFVFTHAGRTIPKQLTYGDRFANFIKANELGTVIKNERVKNPNSRNHVTTFVWNVDWKKLNAYCKAKGFPRYEPYSWNRYSDW